ncbi:MAG: DUF418 domain-containing protein [Chitinophagaceae bacterium]
MTTAIPVKDVNRSPVLDILRGIAILGIFINNIYGFTGYGFLTEKHKQQFSTYPTDNIISFLQTMLIEGKFYSLFSLLFGIGFSIIIIRNEQKGINAFKVFYRRIAILFLIGAAHIYFLWEGDILLLYAILGFVLPLFKKCSDKGLLIWATVLILSPLAIDVIKILLQLNPGDFLQPIAESIDKKTGVPLDDGWRTYLFKDGSGWQEWRNYQSSSFIYRYQSLLNNNRIPKVLGMFLIGFYVGRKMMYVNLSNYTTLLKKLMIWGFVIGIPASFAMAWFAGDGKNVYQSAWGLLDTFFYVIGVVPLSLAYVSAICLFWIKTKGINKLSVFAPVGRMALTNYLLQTIFGVFIFYGVGFGMGQKIGPVYFIPAAIGFYLLQVLFSNFWFKYFQYGPIEWVWRQLTYGKRLPLRNKKSINVV